MLFYSNLWVFPFKTKIWWSGLSVDKKILTLHFLSHETRVIFFIFLLLQVKTGLLRFEIFAMTAFKISTSTTIDLNLFQEKNLWFSFLYMIARIIAKWFGSSTVLVPCLNNNSGKLAKKSFQLRLYQ